MPKETKEKNTWMKEKLKKIGLDLENIPKIFEEQDRITYKPIKEYQETSYKVYQYVDIDKIEIYLTNTTRLEDFNKKYKMSRPLIDYLNLKEEEKEELYFQFLNLLKQLDLEQLEEIEKKQKEFQKQIPFEVKYKNNFIWEIYYSEVEDRYFMLFPMQETRVESLFYLIKKKIQRQKAKKKEYLYTPIAKEEYSYQYLKRSEIADLENYLWFFTGYWPTIYEVQEKDETKTMQIIGKTEVYEKIKSLYKIRFHNKEEAQKQFKLIKALFILQSHLEEEYEFKTQINEKGELDFCFNRVKITYETLPQFMKQEMEKNKQKLNTITEQNILETERWLLLKETIVKQNLEYLAKEKQIVTFLECKKSFFGRVGYFFKSKKKKKEEKVEIQKKEKTEITINKIEIEEKELYTIEDLLKICQNLEQIEKDYKNKKMDIKALENKKENLERKIKNATLYINEIESHKKSIFDFWKFTNKDEIALLTENEIKEQEEVSHKIKKVFSYKEDMEDLAKKIDEKQRTLLSTKEQDAIFAIKQDIESFNLLKKEKKLKKDEKQIEKKLKEKKEQYKEAWEEGQKTDFDIFGNLVEDKTKIKVLKNQKHREVEKDPYKILNIHLETTLEEYKENIMHYEMILQEAYGKITLPYEIPFYQASSKPLEEENWKIMNFHPREAIEKEIEKEDEIILNRINAKENMSVLFYSNIIFFDNWNQTLPLGMDKEKEMLIDLKQYELKLISRKAFKMNYLKNMFENKIKIVQVYEYEMERRTYGK